MDDKQLQVAVANGEVSQAEVERIWRETEDLSPQCDITVRRAVIAMKKAGSLERAWPIFMQEMLQLMTTTMGALTRDESKFAHLVAGTETIVKTLQALNPLMNRLDRIEDMQARLAVETGAQFRFLTGLLEKVIAAKSGELAPTERVAEVVAGAPIEGCEEEAASEPSIEEPYDRCIGSAWADKK